jgi:SNF2 family DNA or RNA helicase
MEKEFVTTLPSGKKLETKYILPQLSYLQQLAGGSISGEDVSDFKIKEVVALLEGELKDESVVIWCRFRWEVDALQKAIKNSVEVITGDTPVEYRSFVQKSFQNGDIKVLISQVATGKFGINLSKSSTAIYYSNSFVPDDRNQSEYRIEHNEKKEPLLYIDMIAKDSIDEQILKTLKKKHIQSRYFMGEIIEGLKEKYK